MQVLEVNVYKLQFLKIDLRLVEKVGFEAACLYSMMRVRQSSLKKDMNGWFNMDYSYVSRTIPLSKSQFIRARIKLINNGLILFVAGSNQNVKPRYKLL